MRLPFLSKRETRRYWWLVAGTVPLAIVLLTVDAFVVKWMPAAFYIVGPLYGILGMRWVVAASTDEDEQ